MFIPPTEDQRICAWFECQTEETLRDLHERFDAVSPRECWTAFFNDCPSPAPQSLGVSLAVPVEAVQEVCIHQQQIDDVLRPLLVSLIEQGLTIEQAVLRIGSAIGLVLPR